MDEFGWLLYISVRRVKSYRTNLPTHSVNSDPHVARMLSHNYAFVLMQIKHGVFVCKVRIQKRLSKVGLVRMVTLNLVMNG